MAWELFEKPGRGARAGAIRHGTRYAYGKRQCRCDECRAANARAFRAYKERKRRARD